MWITLQLWSFGWLSGRGGGAYQVVAGSLVGLQNQPRRSRLSKPWIDSGEADRLRKEDVGSFGSLQHEEDALGLTGTYLASRLEPPVESGFGVSIGFLDGIWPMVECG